MPRVTKIQTVCIVAFTAILSGDVIISFMKHENYKTKAELESFSSISSEIINATVLYRANVILRRANGRGNIEGGNLDIVAEYYPSHVYHHISLSFHESSILKEDGMMMLCFTNNIHSFEEKKMSIDGVYSVSINGSNVVNNENNTYCLHNTTRSLDNTTTHRLPSFFKPEKFGAVSLLSFDGAMLIGNCLYAAKYQRSSYPTMVTVLERTTEEYNIQGSITISGRVGRDPVTKDVFDIPTLSFTDVTMKPKPPALFLRLTLRSAWMRFSSTDVLVLMPGDAESEGLPHGSFFEEGSFRMDFPYEQNVVDIRDYREGYWYLWCETFTITLAGGSIVVM